MKNGLKHQGTVVPMMTPITAAKSLDEAGLDRLIDTLLTSGVEGIFVLGTTGEGINVPRLLRRRLVERTVAKARGRVLVYAGLGDLRPVEFPAANEYFHAGANAVVAHPP